MTKKFTLDMQMEECRRVISDLPTIEGRHQRASKIVFRQDIMRSVCRSLDYLKQNEADIRLFAELRKLKPEVWAEIRRMAGA